MTFFLVSLISMLVMLGILVLVHEFGHFAVAKACGVRVETFSIGFGKRLFGFRHGDTDYRISLLPLGGYVKMAGEMGGDGTMPLNSTSASDTAQRSGNLTSKPRWQRILIACAGPVANFLLALLIMTAVFMGHNQVADYLSGPAVIDYVIPGSPAAAAGMERGDRIVQYDGIDNPNWQQVYVHAVLNLNHPVAVRAEQHGREKSLSLLVKSPNDPDNFSLQDMGFTPVEQSSPLKVALVEPGMPGDRAGLQAGDEVVSVDGIKLHSLSSMIVYLQQNGGKPVTLNILRHGTPITLTVQPQQEAGPDNGASYKIGFAVEPPPSHTENLSMPKAFSQSVHENIKGSTLILDVLDRVVTHRMSVRTLSGPVGIARQTGEIAALPGWTPLLTETATISLNLGILNLLPIPILDGGVILFLLIESVLRRDLNEKFKERVYQAAFVFIILFTVFVLFNDLSKIPTFARLKL